MSDNASNRNSLLALVAVVAIAAVAIGYLLGRSEGPAAGTGESSEVQAALAPETTERPLEAAAEPAAESAVEAPAPAVEAGSRRARRVEPEAAPAQESTPEPAAEEPVELGEPEPEPEPAPVEVTVPTGTRVVLELLGPVSSQSATVGQAVRARVAETIRIDGRTAVAAGSTVTGRVTEAKALRKVGGQAHLALAFESVELEGGDAPLEAYWARTGKSETGKDAATIAAGAVIGTVLGNQAKKNDRGKAIGAVVGAGVGTAIAAATEGETVELAAGDRLELTLRSPIHLLLEP